MTKNPVTIAVKRMANRSSAFRLPALLVALFGAVEPGNLPDPVGSMEVSNAKTINTEVQLVHFLKAFNLHQPGTMHNK